MRLLVVFVIAAVCLAGCNSPNKAKTDSGVADVAAGIREVSPGEAGQAVSKAYSQFVDVRSPEEYQAGHAARSINIPLDTLAANIDRLEKNEPVYLICQSGSASGDAASILKAAGFNNVFTVMGGTTAWQSAGLPMETRPPHNIPPPSK